MARPHRPPLWYPVAALALAFVLSAVATDIALAVVHHHGPLTLSSLTPGLFVADEAGLWVVFVGSGFFAASYWWKASFVRLAGFTIRPVVDIPLGVAVGVACQLVLVPLLYLPFTLVDPHLTKSLSRPAESLVGIGTGAGFIVTFLILVVGAPIAEELFFRGLTFQVLKDHTAGLGPRLGAAVVVVGSGLLFALAHFEPLQFLGLWAVGCVLGYLVLRTGRLGTSIVAHATFNLVAVIALLPAVAH